MHGSVAWSARVDKGLKMDDDRCRAHSWYSSRCTVHGGILNCERVLEHEFIMEVLPEDQRVQVWVKWSWVERARCREGHM